VLVLCGKWWVLGYGVCVEAPGDWVFVDGVWIVMHRYSQAVNRRPTGSDGWWGTGRTQGQHGGSGGPGRVDESIPEGDWNAAVG